MSDSVAALSQTEFFGSLGPDHHAELSVQLVPVAIPAGEIIFRSGDPGDALFIVTKGEVEIFIHDDTGHKIVLENCKTGDVFGELSMLDQGPRTASATVVEDFEGLKMDHDKMLDFLRSQPAAALGIVASMARRLRFSTDRLRRTASRNVNQVVEERQSMVTRLVRLIVGFTGTVTFVNLQIFIFFSWIAINLGWIPGLPKFDPFPFGFLTMIASLEAIILSGFVLISQNVQRSTDRVRSDIEYEVNLKAELEIAHLHEKVDQLNAKILARLDTLEKALTRGSVTKTRSGETERRTWNAG